MARKRNKKSNPLVGCLLIIFFGVIGVWAVWLAPRNPRVPSAPLAGTAYPTVEFIWTRGPYDFDRATTETRADLRICPELRCDVVTSVGAGTSLEIVSIVLGGFVGGEHGWFEVRYDNQLLYVPVPHVFSETVTRMALTESPTNDRRFVTPRPSNTPRVTPTLAPTSDTAVDDVTDYSATMYASDNAIIRACPSTTCQNLGRADVGSDVVVTGMVDGEIVEVGYAIWYRVEHGGVIGYVYQRLLVSEAPVMVATDETTNSDAVSIATPMVCPSNCAEARSLGWSAEMAGQCDNLDRDNDGVACYGD